MEQRIAAPARVASIPVPDGRAGAAIAEGVADLARTAGAVSEQGRHTDDAIAASQHRMALREQENQDAILAGQQASALARLNGELTVELQGLRDGSAPGAVGHVEAARKLIAEKTRQFDEGFGGNERVRRQFVDNIAQVAARAETAETLWGMDSSAKYQANSIESMKAEQVNGFYRDPSPAAFAQAVALGRKAIGLIATDGTTRVAAEQGYLADVAQGWIDANLTHGKHAQVKVLLDKGFFDGLIDTKVARRQVTLAEEGAARERDLAQSRARAAVTEQVSLIRARIDAGINPDPAEIRQVRAAAGAAGLKPDDMFDLALMETKQTINRQYQGRDVMVLIHDRGVLSAKIAAGTASDGEQVAYQHMGSMIDARQKEQAVRYKPLLAQGTSGRQQILREIGRLPPSARFAQAEGVEEGLGYVAILPSPEAQARALQGKLELKANPKLLPKAPGDGKDTPSRSVFKQVVGASGRLRPGTDLAAIEELANHIYADRAARSFGETFSARAYEQAVRAAFGGTQRRDGAMIGGLGRYRGAAVILPQNKTEDEFARGVARFGFPNATYDGRTVASKSDIVKRFMPVYFGEADDGRTLYKFMDSGSRYLKNAKGGDYVMDILP